MTWAKNLLFLGLLVAGFLSLRASLFPLTAARDPAPVSAPPDASADFHAAVAQLNEAFRLQWQEQDLEPAPPAPELAVIRRLSLALTGTIPSLEEIRQLERLPPGEMLPWWVDQLLRDRRYADYFAERLARTFVGTEDGPFIIYRRRRLISWLSDQLLANRPYGEIVHDLIASKGLWTDNPGTNFITVTFENERKEPDRERLGGRVARAFLGFRLDCAECHDHPFEHWKQTDFHALAAFFGQTHQGFTGIYDGGGEHLMEDMKTGKKTIQIAPAVPFRQDLLPKDGARRAQLARWLTDVRPEPVPAYQANAFALVVGALAAQAGQAHDNIAYNQHFSRATVQRIWALLFGRPMLDDVESLSTVEDPPRALLVLERDFAQHRYDLGRLIRVIAASEAFQRDSRADHETTEEHERSFAIFPLSRLRPEQVVGSVQQAATLRTINQDSHLLVRAARAAGEKEFVQRYGDTGEDEFAGRGGTIPQRLLLLNGQLVKEKTKDEMLNAANQIASMAPNDAAAVETAYLVVLTRRPTAPEAEHFIKRLDNAKGKERAWRLEDLYWTLINSTEFSWNH